MFVKKRLMKLSEKFDLFFSVEKSFLYLKGLLGVLIIKLPSFYFFKLGLTSFLFSNRFFFISVFKHIVYLYKRLFFFNYVKLKIKGLGYRIRKLSKSLYCFFFGHTNLFYLHVPSTIIVKARKRRLLMLSNDISVLKKVLAHLLLLKKLSVYRIRGLIYPRQIIVLKIGKKNL